MKTLVPAGALPVGSGELAAGGAYRPGANADAILVPGLAGGYNLKCDFIKNDGSACKNGTAWGTELCLMHLKRTNRDKAAKADWEARESALAKQQAAEAEAARPKLEPVHRQLLEQS